MPEENSTIDWDSYRDEFPVTKEYIYFNNAAVSPLSTRVKEKVNFVLDHLVKEGILCEEMLFTQIAAIRSSAASP
jgi:selenocysteine lyase/cysteine desulfurase